MSLPSLSFSSGDIGLIGTPAARCSPRLYSAPRRYPAVVRSSGKTISSADMTVTLLRSVGADTCAQVDSFVALVVSLKDRLLSCQLGPAGLTTCQYGYSRWSSWGCSLVWRGPAAALLQDRLQNVSRTRRWSPMPQGPNVVGVRAVLFWLVGGLP
jgi:hypothetical protein